MSLSLAQYLMAGVSAGTLGAFFSMMGPSFVGVLHSFGVRPRRWVSAVAGAAVSPLVFGGLLFALGTANVRWTAAIYMAVVWALAGAIGGYTWMFHWFPGEPRTNNDN